MLRIVAAFRGRPAWRLRPPKSRVSWCVICGGDVMDLGKAWTQLLAGIPPLQQ